MNAAWQARMECRKCGAVLLVSSPAGPSEGPSLAIFYCPGCGERTQVEVPAGYDPRSVTATPDLA